MHLNVTIFESGYDKGIGKAEESNKIKSNKIQIKVISFRPATISTFLERVVKNFTHLKK